MQKRKHESKKEFSDWEKMNKRKCINNVKNTLMSSRFCMRCCCWYDASTCWCYWLCNWWYWLHKKILSKESMTFQIVVLPKVGDIAGQIAATSLLPIGRIAPSGAGIGATIWRNAVYGGVFGGLTPVMNEWSDATGDIASSAARWLQSMQLGEHYLKKYPCSFERYSKQYKSWKICTR